MHSEFPPPEYLKRPFSGCGDPGGAELGRYRGSSCNFLEMVTSIDYSDVSRDKDWHMKRIKNFTNREAYYES